MCKDRLCPSETVVCRHCYNEGHTCARFDTGATHSMRFAISQEVATPSPVIRAYVEHELQRRSQRYGRKTWAHLLKTKPHFQKAVLEVIANKAAGSFLVARYCVKFVVEATTPREVENILKDPPVSLEKVYETFMNRILRLSNNDKSLAQRALTYVTLASRPLSSIELREALALRSDRTQFWDPDDMPFADAIVSASQGLIAIHCDKVTNENVFTMHLTLREYLFKFRQTQGHWIQRWRKEMAKNLMKFVNLTEFEHLCVGDMPGFLSNRFERHPYYKYAVLHWMDHVHPYQEDPEILDELVDFLNNQGKILSWLQAASQSDKGEYRDLFVRENALAIHICAGYGFSSVLPRLANFEKDMNVGDPFFHRPPLVYACRQSETKTALQLIHAGALVDVEDSEGWTPLIAAVKMNDPAVVSALLKTSQSININKPLPSEYQRSPLILTVQARVEDPGTSDPQGMAFNEERKKENEQILQLLLKHAEVDVNFADSNGITELNLAVIEGKETLLDHLIAHREIDLSKKDRLGDSPLMNAARCGHLSFVTKLLDSGADRSLAETQGMSFIKEAIDEGQAHIVDAMMNRGEDFGFQKRDRLGRTLLHAASVNGFAKVVDLLIRSEVGPHVDWLGNKGESAIHDACRVGCPDTARVLLRAKARVDIRDEFGRLPRDIARQYGHDEIIDLLDEVTDSNPPGADRAGDEGSVDCSPLPAWSLAYRGDIEPLRGYAERGEDMTVGDPDTSNTPIHWAIKSNHFDVLQLLIAIGVPLDVRNANGDTALHWAATFNNVDCINFLHEKGASLDIKNNWDQTALERAMDAESYGAVASLILAGAKIDDANCSLKQQALFTAVDLNSPQAARLMCEQGANPWILDERRYSARMAAKVYGYEEVFKVLEEFHDPSQFAVPGVQVVKGVEEPEKAGKGGWLSNFSSFLSSSFEATSLNSAAANQFLGTDYNLPQLMP